MYHNFPPPGIKMTMYYVNNKMCYPQSMAELIKASKIKVLKHICENDIFQWSHDLTMSYINEPGKLQPRY